MPHEFQFSDWLPFPIDLSHDEVLICTQLNAHIFFFKSNSNSYEALAALNRDEFLLPSPVNQLLASLVSWTRRKISEVFASGQDCHRKPLNVIYWMNLSTYTLIVKLAAFPFQTFQNIACFPFPNISDYEFISGCQCPASKDPPHSELSSLLEIYSHFFLYYHHALMPFPVSKLWCS